METGTRVPSAVPPCRPSTPEFPAGIVSRRGHEGKSAAARIRANVKPSVIQIPVQPGMSRGEPAGVMVGVIFMIVFAGSNKPELSTRLVGAQEAHFARRMTG